MSLATTDEQPATGSGQTTTKSSIPPLAGVTHEARELWEIYRNVIENKAKNYYPMPVTFQMVPLKMAIQQTGDTKTYYFKARVPNNKYVNVRIRQSAQGESREHQVAVEPRASGGLDEEITNAF